MKPLDDDRLPILHPMTPSSEPPRLQQRWPVVPSSDSSGLLNLESYLEAYGT